MGFAWITWYDLHRRRVQGGARGAQRRRRRRRRRARDSSRNDTRRAELRFGLCGMRLRDRGVGALVVAQPFRAACGSRSPTAPLVAQSQSTELHIKFKSGQSVVPVYEGWERVPDGSFNMVFGYLNRNHVQELRAPGRSAERLRAGSRRSRAADVLLPARESLHLQGERPEGLGSRRRSWSGRSPRTARPEQARATLLDIWEIDRKVEVSNNGGGTAISNELIAKDQPPAVTIAPVAHAKAGSSGHADRGGHRRWDSAGRT